MNNNNKIACGSQETRRLKVPENCPYAFKNETFEINLAVERIPAAHDHTGKANRPKSGHIGYPSVVKRNDYILSRGYLSGISMSDHRKQRVQRASLSSSVRWMYRLPITLSGFRYTCVKTRRNKTF